MYRPPLALPASLDWMYRIVMLAFWACIVMSAGQFIRHPAPRHYIEVNKGFPLTGHVSVRLGPGVKANTIQVGDSKTIYIEMEK